MMDSAWQAIELCLISDQYLSDQYLSDQFMSVSSHSLMILAAARYINLERWCQDRLTRFSLLRTSPG